MLDCKKLRTVLATDEIATGDVKYDDIFENTVKQKEAIVLMKRLLQAKEQAVKMKPPGDNLDPSMGDRLCCSDTLSTLVYCSNCISIGK